MLEEQGTQRLRCTEAIRSEATFNPPAVRHEAQLCQRSRRAFPVVSVSYASMRCAIVKIVYIL